jgi:sugar lactone lactonase YvrE
MSNLHSLSVGQVLSALILLTGAGPGANAQPAITAAPGSLTFSYRFGASAPGQQYIAISNSGTAQYYTAAVTSGNGWLQVAPGGGGVTPGKIPVVVNTAGVVAAGSYAGNVQIAIAGATNSPVNIPVTLMVSGASPLGTWLTVFPASLAFSFQLGSNQPAAQTVSVGGLASGQSYTASVTAGVNWLQALPGDNGTVSAPVFPNGLAEGSYSGSIAIKAPGTANGPIAIPVLLSVGNPQAGALVTAAGTGVPGYSGDAGAAAGAQMDSVYATAADSAGNVYFADTANHRVRKIDPGGGIATVAGTGMEGSSGLGGPAVAAQLSFPRGVATDSAGNIYISDSGNFRVLRLTPDGNLNAFAGNGSRGYSGDGGPAVNGQMRMPLGLAADDRGNLYIADSWNFRLRKVDASGMITTVAGTGINGYSGDGGPAIGANLGFLEAVAVDDRTYTIYVSDPLNSVVRAIDSAGGQIRTVAGTGVEGFAGDGGAALSAQLHFPRGLAVDASGTLYIADSFNNRVRKVDASGNISTVAGTSAAGFSGDFLPAVNSELNNPYGLATDSLGNLYVSDLLNYRIRECLLGWPSIGGLKPASSGGSRALAAGEGSYKAGFRTGGAVLR